MKKAIFSVITGGYDELPIAPKFEGWDSIMFTDMFDEDLNYCDLKGWEIRLIPKVDDPLVQSRDIKIRPHIHLPEYDLVCYIDGNQKLLREPIATPIWYTHSKRKNIFEEGEQIIKNGRFPADIINAQLDYYREQGYQDCGLYLNGYHIRQNKDPDINRLHDVWFEETCRFAPRDQLSLPYAIWYTGIQPENITYPAQKESFAVIMKGHKQNYYR